MVDLGDVYSVTITQRYREQTMENVFFYMLTTQPETGLPADVAVAIRNYTLANLLPAIRNMQVNTLTHTRMVTYNLFDVTSFDEYTYPAPIPGSLNQDGVSTFVAVQARAPRTRRDMRPGYKRFAGASETLITAGAINPAVSPFPALQTELNETIVTPEVVGTGYDGGDTLVPVIVKRISYPDPDDPDRTLYRLPEAATELTFYNAAWVLLPQTTTQNTRKVGRGE